MTPGGGPAETPGGFPRGCLHEDARRAWLIADNARLRALAESLGLDPDEDEEAPE
jgi:hypothetical protein